MIDWLLSLLWYLLKVEYVYERLEGGALNKVDLVSPLHLTYNKEKVHQWS